MQNCCSSPAFSRVGSKTWSSNRLEQNRLCSSTRRSQAIPSKPRGQTQRHFFHNLSGTYSRPSLAHSGTHCRTRYCKRRLYSPFVLRGTKTACVSEMRVLIAREQKMNNGIRKADISCVRVENSVEDLIFFREWRKPIKTKWTTGYSRKQHQRVSVYRLDQSVAHSQPKRRDVHITSYLLLLY